MACNIESGKVRLVYRSTFIDEETSSADDRSSTRSQSVPPAKIGLEEASEVVRSETELHGYVKDLVTNAQHLSPSAKVSTPMAFSDRGASGQSSTECLDHSMSPSSRSSSSAGALSLGSRGHPQLCRRPCIYYFGASCSSGASCLYCHLPHEDKAAKLDKQQRQKFASLDVGIALGMLHNLLLAKATEYCFLEQAHELLSLVHEEARTRTPGLEQMMEEVPLQRIQRVFARMPFHQLAVLAGSKSANASFSEKVQAALEDLSETVESLQTR